MAKYVEKESIFLRIAKYLIPWKGDKPAEIIRKLVFFAAAVTLIVSMVILLTTASDKIADTQDNNELSEIFHNWSSVQIDTAKKEQLLEDFPEVREEFLPLLEINEDIIGWITIGDLEDPFIDYVIVQGEDNDYYLTHNYKKENSVSGAIFADYRDPITADSSPANIILYGHNMMSGEYFAKLTRYFNYRPGNTEGLDFYKKHPTLTFTTLYEQSTYKIFGGMLVNTRKQEGDVFYYLNGRNFSTKADFDDYVAQVLDRSTFYTDVDIRYGDELLTMSTCIFDYGDKEIRWVMYARKVREGEDPEVDVSKAYENPDPLYFDYYYSLYGGSWGGRKWPADMIMGYSY